MGSPSRWPEYLGSPEPGRTKIRLGLDLPSISCCIESNCRFIAERSLAKLDTIWRLCGLCCLPDLLNLGNSSFGKSLISGPRFEALIPQ